MSETDRTGEITRDRGEIHFWRYAIPIALVVALVVLAVRHDPGSDPYDVREQKVRRCIADGGDPRYAVDRYGLVTDYFGCVKP
jgi:hypothetical protein